MTGYYDIGVEYNKAYVRGGKAYIIFDIIVYNMSNTKVSIDDIKKAVLKRVGADKFVRLSDISSNKAVYEFDVDEWLAKSIQPSIISTPDRFEKRMRLSRLPAIVARYINPSMIISAVNASFRNWLGKNKKVANKLLSSMTCAMKPLMSYLKFDYDNYFNMINISMKPELRARPSLLYMASNPIKS